jgi:hypothetical protein
MNGMQDAAAGIRGFPAEQVSQVGDAGSRVTVVRDLDTILIRAYEEGRLPAEMRVPWAVSGRDLDVRGYEVFPGL